MIALSEPATLATDMVMAVLAFSWSRDLGKGRRWAWAWAFAALALGSLLGGIFHGFQLNFPETLNALLWRATLGASSLSSLFMLLAGLSQFGRPEGLVFWRRLAALKFILCLATEMAVPLFLVVLVDFSVSILALALLALTRLKVLRVPALQFLAGTLLFVLGGCVQQFRIAPHPSFNHNDLFHVIQIAGNGMFYLCARKSPQEKPAL